MKRLKQCAAIVAAVICAAAVAACGYEEHGETVFGAISFQTSIYGGSEKKAIAQMSAFLHELDESISLTREDSELSAFNRSAPGDKTEVSVYCYELALEAKRMYEETDGAFNVALAPLSRLWQVDAEGIAKYDPIFLIMPDSLPEIIAVKDTLAKCDLTALETEEKDGKYYLSKRVSGLELDLGGIAKGYAADKCMEIAKKCKAKSAYINISGNLWLLGKFFNTDGGHYQNWQVNVSAPRPRVSLGREPVCAFMTDGDVSVVTSGDYERFYYYTYAQNPTLDDVIAVTHIISPFTGLPIGLSYDEETGQYYNDFTADYVTSATVVGTSSLTADSYATAVCVMGFEKGVAFLEKSGLGGIVFTENRYALTGGIEFAEIEGIDGYQMYERA